MTESSKGYRLLGLILLSLGVGIVGYSALSQLSGILTIHDYEPFFLESLQFYMLKVWLPWAILSPLVMYIAKRYPITPTNWLPMIGVHIAVLMVLVMLQSFVISFHYHFFETMSESMASYQPWQHIGHFLFGDDLFLFHIIIYTVFVASQNLKNFYAFAQEKKLESETLTRQLMESKLLALRMQINPHFLFNTLNIISVLVLKEEKRAAADLLEKLSAFFRQTLEESDTQWVPLKTELEIIDQYLFIEKARFGKRLKITNEIDESLSTVCVPSMILQPLVENAVSHGIGEKPEGGTLTILCKRVGGRLLMEIKDDGVGCDFDSPGYKPGIGLENVRQRLVQLYDNNHLFRLEGQAGEGVRVSIELPISTDKESLDED